MEIHPNSTCLNPAQAQINLIIKEGKRLRGPNKYYLYELHNLIIDFLKQGSSLDVKILNK